MHPELVLPTRVGMVRYGVAAEYYLISSPHPRGDGPPQTLTIPWYFLFSPPAWGWSEYAAEIVAWHAVLPTRVGMVRVPAALLV